MDRKSILILAAAMALLFGMSPLVDHFFPPKPIPVTAQSFVTNKSPVENVPVASATTERVPAEPAIAEQILTVSNEDLIWHFTSDGGGIKTIDLRKYPAVIKRTAAGPAPTTPASLNTNAPVPIMSLMGGGIQGNNDFTVTQSGETIHAEKMLTNGLRLVKEFDLGSNCFFNARLWLENTTSNPLTVPAHELVIGTSTAVSPLDDPTAIGAIWYNGLKSQNVKAAWFANRTFVFFHGTPRSEYSEGASNVVWASVHNQFFVLAAIPSNPAPGLVIDQIRVPAPELREPTNAMSASLTNGYQRRWPIRPRCWRRTRAWRRTSLFYAGPKEYNRLAQIGQAMNNNLDLIMDFTGVFTGFFSKLLLLSMNGLHALAGIGLRLDHHRHHRHYQAGFLAADQRQHQVAKAHAGPATADQGHHRQIQGRPGQKNEKTMEFHTSKTRSARWAVACRPCCNFPSSSAFTGCCAGPLNCAGRIFSGPSTFPSPTPSAYTWAGFPSIPCRLIMGATQLWQAHIDAALAGHGPRAAEADALDAADDHRLFYRMSPG
jgi:YidC/Oxa1 family membrane protein insertase